MARLKPFFPKPHGKPHVDDKRVLSGIILINRNGLRWVDAPPKYGPPKTLYNRWIRWSRKGVFVRILIELAREGNKTDVLMIAAIHLKAHRTASSLVLKKRQRPPDWADKRRFEFKTARCAPSRDIATQYPAGQ